MRLQNKTVKCLSFPAPQTPPLPPHLSTKSKNGAHNIIELWYNDLELQLFYGRALPVQCRPRCTAWTFNLSQALGLGTP